MGLETDGGGYARQIVAPEEGAEGESDGLWSFGRGERKSNMRCNSGSFVERERARALEKEDGRERPGSAEAELPYCHYRREEMNHYPVDGSSWLLFSCI